jgi:hypothetical protein
MISYGRQRRDLLVARDLWHQSPGFAEAWNGTSRRLVKTANPHTGLRWLNGVSCTADGRCMAVGNSGGNGGSIKGTGAFAEVWNGISWHLLKVPGPGSLVNGPGWPGFRARWRPAV